MGLLSATIAAATLSACGGGGDQPSGSGGGNTSHGSNAGGGSSDGGGLGVGGFGHQDVKSLEVKPATGTLDVQSGSNASMQFVAIAHYANGSSGQVAATWSADALAVGSIDGAGKFTANGTQGGVVDVTASYGGKKATAKLTVVLHVSENPANADTATKAALRGASAADASVVWAYPYDATVFPRGIGAPLLMWNNGNAPDVYYVHIVSSTFELEAFTTAPPPSQYQFSTGVWDQLANSTSGATELKVARWDGTNATVVVDHHDRIADGAMHGTIYYWAINTGRVMRIQPGAAAPDDFLGGGVACPSCHTVSANGSTLLMNTSYAGSPPSWPYEDSVSYDLVNNTSTFTGLNSGGSGASPYALSGASADGKYLLENFAPLRGPIGNAAGVIDTTSGAPVTGTGIDTLQAWMPAFSPDNKLIAYVTGNNGDLHVLDWDGSQNPPQATNDHLLVAAGSDASKSYINNPTISPDHKWVMYQRSSGYGSLNNMSGDLYLASVEHPGTEVALDALNGTGYPFAAGARDVSQSFEPTFAPVASGGYFWVVFHARRTWGNQLTGPAFVAEGNGTKQLWVAAIDQSPGNADPSHAAFHLPGQALDTLNMRGFWALPPCKPDGQSCASGTDCCGGYCDPAPDGGAGVCKSNSGGGCSHEGDHCDSSGDCCAGTCINDHCAQAPPH